MDCERVYIIDEAQKRDVVVAISSRLGMRPEERTSAYLGDYVLFGLEDGRVVVRSNTDPLDGEPVYAQAPSGAFFVEVSSKDAAAKVSQSLADLGVGNLISDSGGC